MLTASVPPRGGGSDGHASSCAMVLSEKKHHTSRGQRRDRTREEEYTTHYTGQFQKTPLPQAAATVYQPVTDDECGELAAGAWPTPLDGRRPQGKVERHGGIGYELVLALDAPVLQMVDQLVDVLNIFDAMLPVVAEQVIEVTKIILQDSIPPRTVLCSAQMVGQLVEVPTVAFFSRRPLTFQFKVVEQLFMEVFMVSSQGSSAFSGEEHQGQQGFHPRQSSTSRWLDVEQ